MTPQLRSIILKTCLYIFKHNLICKYKCIHYKVPAIRPMLIARKANLCHYVSVSLSPRPFQLVE